MFDEQNKILTVHDVCEILYIEKNRVYKLLNTGLLKGFRLGKTWRIPKKSSEVYILQRCRTEN